MRNKKIMLAAVVASVVASASAHAKLGGAYVGLIGVNAFSDTAINASNFGEVAAGNLSLSSLGFGIEAGYDYSFGNILVGGGLSYIYAAPNFKHVAKGKEAELSLLVQDINGHRINLDINAGYSFEDKVALTVGGIISYNPGEPKYLTPGFDKKTTNDFGFGFKVGTDIKLTECLSLDISYRMTWFGTTKDYKDLAKKISDDAKKVSEISRVDKMITAGIRYNF